MNARSLAIAGGALLLVFDLALVAAVAYPLSERDHRPAEEAFEVGETDSYRVTASITVDGSTALAVEGAVGGNGTRYLRVEEDGVVSEQFQAGGTDGREYARLVVERGGDRRLQRLRSDPDREVVHAESSGGSTTILTVADEPHSAVDPSGPASVVANQLRLVAYGETDGPAGAGDRELRSLRPRDGWYDGSRSYRITDASGTVTIDPATDVVYSADVRWDLTRGTPTYAHYLLQRDGTATQEIAYEYRTGDVGVAPPDWVERVRTAREASAG